MKKILSITLTLTMLFAMTAMAVTVSDNNNSASADVKANYLAGDTSGTVYSVDITWGALEFTYKDKAQGTWNPNTHKYDGGSETGTWSANGNTITVTNHSNAPVTASMSYNSDVTGVEGAFNINTLELESAVDTSYDNAPKKTSSLTLSGVLPSTYVDLNKVGTVTVVIDDASVSNPGSDETNDEVIITKMTTTSNLSNAKSTGVVIDVVGANLQEMTAVTLNQYLNILVDDDNDTGIILGSGLIYSSISSEKATITISSSSFMNLSGNIKNLRYVLLSNGEENLIELI